MKQLVFTLTGPSCAGKSTLEKRLVDTGRFASIRSTTTRPMRIGEADGVHYDFVTKERFLEMVEAKEFVETVQIGDNFYGAPRARFLEVMGQGKAVVIVVEPNGREQIEAFCEENDWHCFTVFVNGLPQTLVSRLLGRFVLDINNGSAQAVMNLGQRLVQMLGVEATWVSQMMYEDIYDLVIPDFNGELGELAVRFLNSLAGKMLANTPEDQILDELMTEFPVFFDGDHRESAQPGAQTGEPTGT